MMEKAKMDSNAKDTNEVFEAKVDPVFDKEPQVFQNPNVDFPEPKDKKKQVGKKKQITITFRHNRTFELHLGQEVMRFEGRETKQIDKELLKHPAFIQARKYFNIKGI